MKGPISDVPMGFRRSSGGFLREGCGKSGLEASRATIAALVASVLPLGDFAALGPPGDFCELDLRRGRFGLVRDFPAVARTGTRCRLLLVDLVSEGLEPDSDVVLEVEPDVLADCACTEVFVCKVERRLSCPI